MEFEQRGFQRRSRGYRNLRLRFRSGALYGLVDQRGGRFRIGRLRLQSVYEHRRYVLRRHARFDVQRFVSSVRIGFLECRGQRGFSAVRCCTRAHQLQRAGVHEPLQQPGRHRRGNCPGDDPTACDGCSGAGIVEFAGGGRGVGDVRAEYEEIEEGVTQVRRPVSHGFTRRSSSSRAGRASPPGRWSRSAGPPSRPAFRESPAP